MGGRGGLCSVEFSQEDRVDADHLQNKLLSSTAWAQMHQRKLAECNLGMKER